MKEESKSMKEERGRDRERESVKEGKRKARSTVHIAKFYQFPSEFPANGRVLYFAHKYSAFCKYWGPGKNCTTARGFQSKVSK